MSKTIRTERGWPGHFICADRCRFRRNTLLSADGKPMVVVSTVGNLIIREKLEEVGSGRHYETAAFWTDGKAPYFDIDVGREIFIESAHCLAITKQNEETVDSLADEMHEAVLAELMAKLEKGELIA